MKKLLITTVTAMALALPAVAQPRPGMGRSPGARGPMGGGFRPEMIEAVAAEIGVSEATVQKIKDRMYQSHKEQIGLKAKVEEAHLELRRLMDPDRPKVDAIMRQVEALGRVETEVKKHHIRLMLSIRELLTPEQWRKLHHVMQSRRGRRHPDGGQRF